jgi:hypothetical protein
LLGNPHISEFLDRLRVRCWAFAVPQLRRVSREGGLAGLLWAGHPQLGDAVERRDLPETEQLLRDRRAHALALATELTDP